jgi:translation initiation factor 2D
VYALWREPELMPRLEVHAPVSEFVLRGADVMLPGVVFASPDEVASLRKGELRAVFARGNPGAIAVGEVLVDAADISRTGKKGRALKLWHVFGDELWKLGPQTVPNDGFFANRVVPVGAQTGAAVDNDQDSDDAGEEVGNDEGEEKSELPVSVGDIQLDDAGDDTEQQEQKTEEVSKEQMDAWFVSALLQAFKTGKIKEKELPMLASTFHATVLLPSRPASATLNLKQSSFKKLSVFLLHMQHRGLLAFSENNSGVQSITAISRRHPYVHARLFCYSCSLLTFVRGFFLLSGTSSRTSCTSRQSKPSSRKRRRQRPQEGGRWHSSPGSTHRKSRKAWGCRPGSRRCCPAFRVAMPKRRRAGSIGLQ